MLQIRRSVMQALTWPQHGSPASLICSKQGGTALRVSGCRRLLAGRTPRGRLLLLLLLLLCPPRSPMPSMHGSEYHAGGSSAAIAAFASF